MTNKVRRITDLKTYKWLLKQDDIARHAFPTGVPADLGRVIHNKDIYLYYVGKTYVMFHRKKRGMYEAEIMVLKADRGPTGLRNAQTILRYMFTEHHAECIFGLIIKEHLRSRIFASAAGFVAKHKALDYLGRECVHYRLEKSRWQLLQDKRQGLSAEV